MITIGPVAGDGAKQGRTGMFARSSRPVFGTLGDTWSRRWLIILDVGLVLKDYDVVVGGFLASPVPLETLLGGRDRLWRAHTLGGSS